VREGLAGAGGERGTDEDGVVGRSGEERRRRNQGRCWGVKKEGAAADVWAPRVVSWDGGEI
jgi:hypothetical protein